MKVKASLRRVRLNRDGYAPGGYYFGVGAPLYEVECWAGGPRWESMTFLATFHVRGTTRDKAKEAARREVPQYVLVFNR